MIYREWCWSERHKRDSLLRGFAPYNAPERPYRAMVPEQSKKWLLLPHYEVRNYTRWIVISEDTEVSLKGWL